MATYKPYKKTESGKEEIKIPYSVLSNPPDLSVYAKLAGGNTFSGNQVITGYIDIRGTAAEKHLKTRGIGGSDGNGNSSDLYLQYSSNYKTYFGNTAQSSLNADGSISINGKTAAITDQIPTKVSELTNDSEFITSDGSVKRVIDYNDTSKNIKIGYSGAGITGGDIKYIAGYTASDGTAGNVARIKDISKDALKSWLGYATVATSGNYNDLSNKPTPAIKSASLSGTTLYLTL